MLCVYYVLYATHLYILNICIMYLLFIYTTYYIYRKCGRKAGCRTVLIRTHENEAVCVRHPELVDYYIDSLTDLIRLIH